MNSPDLSPKLSIIIPAFERVDGLIRAIAKVLEQIDERAEVIVVDDGSETPLAEQLDVDGFRLIRLAENFGPARARNAGVASASADWVTFLDSDDCWLPGRYKQLIEIVEEDKPGLMVWGSAVLRRKKDKLIYHKMPPRALEAPLNVAGCRMCPGSTMLLCKETFEHVGDFDEGMRRIEDYDWFLRFFALGGKFIQETDARVFIDGAGSSGLDRVEPSVMRLRSRLTRVPKIVGAYLHLEMARACWHDKVWGRFAKHLFLSRNLYRRFGLQVQPVSTRKLKARELDLLATLKSVSDQ